MGSSSDIICPKISIAPHRAEARRGVPNEANNKAIFDDLDVREYFVGINGTNCLRDAIDLQQN